MASTIQVDNIKDIGGNTIISSDGSGTFTSNLPASAPNVSTATGTLPIANGGTGAATLAAAGLTNTPAFFVSLTSNQTVSDNVKTLITWTNEVYDTNSAFASNKFTVPSGEGGKYYVSAAIRADASWAATGQFNVMVFVGSTGDNGLFASYNIAASNGNGGAVSGILDLPAGEEITMRLYHNEGGTEGLQAGRYCTVFSGYKLIGI